MRRLGAWLLLSMLASAQGPERVLSLESTVSVQLAGEESTAFRMDVPAGCAARLILHEERGIAGRIAVFDADGAALMRLDPTYRVPAAQNLTLLAGRYRVAIEPAFHSPSARKFSLEIGAANPETEADRLRHAAEISQGEGEWIYSKFEVGYLTDSLPKAEAALAIWEKVGKGPGLPAALQFLAGIEYAQGDMPKSRAMHQRALDLWTTEHDELGIATALNAMAAIDFDTGKPKASLEGAKKALDIRRKSGSLRAQGESLVTIGSAENAMGNAVAARADFEEALRVAVEDGHRLLEGSIRDILGIMEYQQGNYATAEKFYLDALAFERAENAPPYYAVVLSNLGTLYLDSGDPRQGIHYLEQALPLRKTRGQPGSEAVTLYNLAKAHHRLGEDQLALDELNESLPSFRLRHFVVGEAWAMQEMADIYADTGEPAKAEALLKQALAARRTTSDRRGETATLLRLGRLHESQGQVEKSVEELRESLKLARAAGYQVEQVQSLSGLASGLIALKQYRAALEPIAEELELTRKAGIPLEEGEALNLRGQALAALGEVEPARDAFTRAVAVQHQLGDRSEAVSLKELARLEADSGSMASAREHAMASLEIVESLRSNIGSPASRMRIASSHRGYYDLAVELATRAGDAGEALAIAERGRARSFIDLLAEAQVDLHKGVDPALVAKEKQLQELLDARHERLLRLLEGPHEAARETAARRDVDAALESYRKIQGEIRMKSPEYAAIAQPSLLKLDDIRAWLQDSGAAFIEFWLGETRSYAWLVTRTDCRSFELPARAKLEAAARRLHHAASARNMDVTETPEVKQKRVREAAAEFERASQELGRMLAEPLGSLSEWKRWWVVTDGALDYVPLSALPAADGVAAGARHEIVNLPSASAAAEIARLAEGRSRPAGEVAVFADPVFRADDIRMTANRAPGVPVAAMRGGVVSDVGVEGLGSLPRLYFSREEAEAIGLLVAHKRKWMALDFEASRASVESARLADYRIVHFATHAQLNTERPELSGIVLSMLDREGRPQDGFLALHEIYNLKLRADLVVLSGCQTALGESVRSEGIVGLARGFLHAGSSQVLASLWSVPDRGAAEFMRRFYDALLRRGQDAAAALESAQVSMMGDPRWKDPYYWAAFRLEGSPGRTR